MSDENNERCPHGVAFKYYGCPECAKASELAAPIGSASWCDKCQALSVGHMHRSGIYVPGCQHDSKERRVWQLLKDIEQHCPCGARPESPHTHPHVGGCPVDEALRLMKPNVALCDGDKKGNEHE